MAEVDALYSSTGWAHDARHNQSTVSLFSPLSLSELYDSLAPNITSDIPQAIKPEQPPIETPATMHKRIAIIGAGFSGTLAAIHLLRQAKEPVEVMLIEKSERRRSGGIAYSAETATNDMYTNNPIERLSAFEGDSEDLLRWTRETLTQNKRDDWPNQYKNHKFINSEPLPRVLYQKYLEARLQEATTNNPMVRLTKHNGEVVDVIDSDTKSTVVLADGTAYEANQTILATGYTTPKQARFTSKLTDDDRYIADQYSIKGKKQRAGIDPTNAALIVGSGLSAYDAIADLIQHGHKGKIYVISRGGYTHEPSPSYRNSAALRLPGPAFITRPAFMSAATVPDLIAGIRKDFWERTKIEGYSSEGVMEAYQLYLPELLSKFPADTIQQLLKEHSSLIATLRVGVGEQIARVIEEAKISGQLTFISGNIHEMEPTKENIQVRYTPSGSTHDEILMVDRVLSCLGRETGKDDLWHNMFMRGQSQHHFTGHGIQVDHNGAVIDAHGNASPNIIAVGPMRAGDTMARRGLIGPAAQNIPGMREQTVRAALLALEGIAQQAPVNANPVDVPINTIADSLPSYTTPKSPTPQASFNTR
jgi:uncharacterized NAD(P)/FAD-binding protein YdhS